MLKHRLLIEAQYLPPVQYFVLLAQAEELRLEACEHYQKRSYRNRCVLAGANGLLPLSVPLAKGKHQQQTITAVEIAYHQPWPSEHWHSIRSAYGKAPFFEFYADEIEAVLRARPATLFALNRALLEKLMELLQIDCTIALTESYAPAPEGLLDLRDAVHPKAPKRPFKALPYPQLFLERHGFLPNLSILDLLFCTGPQAAVLLEQFAEQNLLA